MKLFESQCPICNKGLKSTKGLSLHFWYNSTCKEKYNLTRTEIKTKGYQLECPTCFLKIKSKLGISGHTQKYKECKAGFEKMKSDSQRSDFNFKCPCCSKLMRRKGFAPHLSRNIRCHEFYLKNKKDIEKTKINKCLECNMAFKRSFLLDKHLFEVHQKRVEIEKTKKYIPPQKNISLVSCSQCRKQVDFKHIKSHSNICGNKDYFNDIILGLSKIIGYDLEFWIVDGFKREEFTLSELINWFKDEFGYDSRNLISYLVEKHNLDRVSYKKSAIMKAGRSFNFKKSIRSKIETLVFNLLEARVEGLVHSYSYKVSTSVNGYGNRNYVIDMMIPDKKIAIEYDGIHHFKKTFSKLSSDEYLAKASANHFAKDFCLLKNGFSIIHFADFGGKKDPNDIAAKIANVIKLAQVKVGIFIIGASHTDYYQSLTIDSLTLDRKNIYDNL